MVDLLEIPLVPIQEVVCRSDTALIMVDSQPRTGRRANEALTPQIVLDHHETPGELEGVLFRDIRPNLGATSTLVTGYLLEQDVAISRRLATALLYGIESETNGYPREAGPADDGALVWLFPRADKDLLAKIRNPRLPLSYYETIQFALANAFVYRDVLFCFCGRVTQPDIVAEVADFFIRFEGVEWVFASGVYERQLKLSGRVDHIGGHCGDLLRSAVNGIGTAGGHDKRAGGAILLDELTDEKVDQVLRTLRERLLAKLDVKEDQGRRLLESSPTIQVP
jgi:nanoRNase/pAp phosphatase (c-di-AMP/oligoRNAs hydrolase)